VTSPHHDADGVDWMTRAKDERMERDRGALLASAEKVRAAAARIPPGGSIQIRGGHPVSGYNLGMWVAKILERLAKGEDVYPMLCAEPPTPPAAGSRVCPRCHFATMRPGPKAWECARLLDCGYRELDA
jgi:hypothetical protein